MRKLSLLVCGSLVLLGALGLGGQPAWAGDPEPDCAGKPVGVQGLHAFIDPWTEFKEAEVYGGAALCGSNLTILGELKAGYTQALVLNAGQTDVPNAGATMRCANPNGLPGHTDYCDGTDLPVGSLAGKAGVNMIVCTSGRSGCKPAQNGMSYNYVDTSKSGYTNDRCNDKVTIIQCFESQDNWGLGHGDVTIEVCSAVTACKAYDPQGVKYLVTMYPPKAIAGGIYYTEIGEPDYNHSSEPDSRDYTQCKYARVNPGSSTLCGTDPANWLQKNPPAGVYGCSADPAKVEGFGARAMAFGLPKPYYQACDALEYTK